MRISSHRLKRYIKSSLYILLICIFMIAPGTGSTVQAITGPGLNSLVRDRGFYDPTSGVCDLSGSEASSSSKVESNGKYQEDNARAIIGIAKTLELGQKGALIGLMTALVESGLQNYANDGTHKKKDGSQPYINTKLSTISQALPHDAVGSDNDSVGIMQQRAVDGNWGPVDPDKDLATNIKWLMTPAYAAEAFFAIPEGKKDQKAMVNVKDWETKNPGAVAQAVQGSAFPDRYIKKKDKAQSLIDQFWDSTQPIPLPVPLAGTGGDTAPSGAGTTGGQQPDGCNNLSTGSGTISAIVTTVFKFARPSYIPRGESGAMDMQPAYVEYLKTKGAYSGACSGVDCGAFVTAVMRASGADPNYNPKNGDTSAQLNYLEENSGTGKKYSQVTDFNHFKTGDIAVRDGHTYMYVGKITGPKGEEFKGDVASSSMCERAPMAGGKDDPAKYKWFRLNAAN
jgi:hypothetical protein